MKNSNTGRSPVKGFGPTVRGVRKLSLPVRSGQITAGDLWPYRPFPKGVTVVIDVRDGYWMHRTDAESVGCALAHVGQIQIEGSYEGNESGDHGFGRIFGVEAIAEVIAEAARLQAQHDEQMEEWA